MGVLVHIELELDLINHVFASDDLNRELLVEKRCEAGIEELVGDAQGLQQLPRCDLIDD